MSDFVGQPPTPAEESPIPVERLSNSLSAREAATILGVSDQTIRRRLQRGEIAGELLAGEWRVFREGPFASALVPVQQALNAPMQVVDARELVSLLRETLNNEQRLSTALRVAEAENVALRAKVAELTAQHDQQLLSAPKKKGWWRRWAFTRK